MKLYFEIIKALYLKYIRKMNTGIVIKKFCEKMGIVYIKFAQMLATQNIGDIFNEKDRLLLSSICDNCKPIEFEQIANIIENEYKKSIQELFIEIDKNPLGSASISQVHKAKLKSGDIVAVKVKRKDITDGIEKDIKRIKSLVHKFGRFVNFKNFIGGDKALELYLKWIYEETDFVHEKENIKTYSLFANSVNGKVANTKNIKVPKLYEELCTKNIIVMEYIDSPTINHIELNTKNSEVISNALNSYLQLSFYALLNDKKIVFHGDPHGGNIYIDSDYNIGFLDMGLIFELSEEDSKLTKDFFLAAYSGNYKKIYDLLEPYCKINSDSKEKLINDIKEYCENVKTKPITSYFMDMVNICLRYEVAPPNFLFCMAKAFVCLGGINTFSKNVVKATDLLKEQTIEYFIRLGMMDSKRLAVKGIKLTPKLLENTCKYGIVNGMAKEVIAIEEIKSDLKLMLEHYEDALNVLKFVE